MGESTLHWTSLSAAWELEYELTKMKKMAAQGTDSITAKLLYNMDGESIKKDLLERPSRTQTRAVLALDLKGAFDNVTHESVLRGLANIDCGQNTYGYIRSFLTDRTAILNIGSPRLEPDAVLSPLLFDLALKGLPEILNNIRGIELAIYTDDITICLQRAANAVVSHARDCGLQCPPQKSELLVFKNPYSRQPPADLSIYVDGQEILTQLGRNLSTINKLNTSTTHVVGMLRRIGNQWYGLKEKESIQLVYAFVVSRVMYATPYMRLTQTEANKLHVIIRRAFKCTPGLPEYVAMDDLLSTSLALQHHRGTLGSTADIAN
ncbi:hypothetical protein HPB47_002570 [Ixodes persulcatus]|uniref:Uncharacterized protein n=1 Tax=Ixodes persulcatus TaxID=34615 RepID=A0AC60PM20_IXOPE|nr:hypothetical protein HPB47_002570 [Ixodes persulcatus]